jgi:hypothetical protein
MGTIKAAAMLAATSSVALAQPPSGAAVTVTVDNYNRAQSDVYFGHTVKTGASASSGMAASWRRSSAGA